MNTKLQKYNLHKQNIQTNNIIGSSIKTKIKEVAEVDDVCTNLRNKKTNGPSEVVNYEYFS